MGGAVRLPGCVLLAALLLVPLAHAGDEANPDITDTQDATKSPDLDFLAAWFEADPSGVLVTFKVREMDALVPLHGMAVGFDYHGERWVALVGVKADGSLASSVGARQQFAASNAPDAMANNLDRVEARVGKPGYYSFRIPYAAVPGLGPGAVLQNVGGSTVQFTPGSGWKEVDGTRALDGYAVQRAILPASVAKALPYVVAAILLVGVGAAGAWLALRRPRTALLWGERGALSRGPLVQDARPPDAPAERMSLRPPSK